MAYWVDIRTWVLWYISKTLWMKLQLEILANIQAYMAENMKHLKIALCTQFTVQHYKCQRYMDLCASVYSESPAQMLPLHNC